MQTNFTEEQLKIKDNKSSEEIFKKCVHCGMCNATCPTYEILGDELDGPRGRIYLIQDMLENERKPTSNVVKHIDRCLSCYSCMTTCPAGVNYMHLIDHGRKYIEKNYERPFFDRIIRNFLSKILPDSKLFKLSIFFVKLGKPFKFLFPSKIKNMMDLMPVSFPKKVLKVKEIYKTKNKKRIARVALLTGCVQKEISPQINESTIRILNRHGVEVVVPEKIRCCGSLNHHLGKNDEANQDFINNINIWYDENLKGNLDAILSNTSGCGTTMKDYAFIFRNDKKMKKKAKKISELTKDVSEYLSENLNLKFKKKEKKLRIAYHSACSMQHGQKIHSQPMNLLEKTKNEILEIPEGHICCGSAGTYNILQSKIAKQLLKNKVKNIESLKPQIISTGNIGCITQIRHGTNIPILHTIELLDWYTGGPKPKILNKL
jgi:glycolate oxidase iron-sulfur subunit